MVFTVIVHLDVKSEHVEKVKAKLIEASRIYTKDKGTIDWFVSQDVADPTKFAIVERSKLIYFKHATGCAEINQYETFDMIST
ncbi:unnamed protein product [Rotaria sp. Silwood2]|nr:unnamed protein product [Rotaria sp. Silwood2]